MSEHTTLNWGDILQGLQSISPDGPLSALRDTIGQISQIMGHHNPQGSVQVLLEAMIHTWHVIIQYRDIITSTLNDIQDFSTVCHILSYNPAYMCSIGRKYQRCLS